MKNIDGKIYRSMVVADIEVGKMVILGHTSTVVAQIVGTKFVTDPNERYFYCGHNNSGWAGSRPSSNCKELKDWRKKYAYSYCIVFRERSKNFSDTVHVEVKDGDDNI